MALGILWETWSKVLVVFYHSTFYERVSSGTDDLRLYQIIYGTLSVYDYRQHYSGILFSAWNMVFVYCLNSCSLVGFGFLVLSLILRFGTDVQSLSWAIVLPFSRSGYIFPSQYLPESVRWISTLLPTSYLFESLHGQLAGKSADLSMIGMATALNILYILASYLLFQHQYKMSRITGRFARMES